MNENLKNLIDQLLKSFINLCQRIRIHFLLILVLFFRLTYLVCITTLSICFLVLYIHIRRKISTAPCEKVERNQNINELMYALQSGLAQERRFETYDRRPVPLLHF